MYAATLNILQQFLGLWAEVIPQKLFACNNVYNKHFPITSHSINLGWFHQRSKIYPSKHTQFAFMQHRMVPKYEENNMNDQFLHLISILSLQPMNKHLHN